tara:strand:- start:646 stop:789 length:144 start_codon:yes stop_codon:yes gene_type:complete
MQQKPTQDNIIDFPEINEIDKQFLELERQKLLIEQQRKEIKKEGSQS